MVYLDALLRIVGSMIEGYSLLFLGISVFRLPAAGLHKRILLISSFISLVSYLMLYVLDFSLLENNIVNLALCLIACLSVFRIRFFYAFLILVSGYFTYGFIQTAIIFLAIVPFFSGAINVIQGNGWLTFLAQLSSSAVATTCSYLLRRSRFGFCWLEEKVTIQKSFQGFNLIVTIVCMICIFGASMMLEWEDSTEEDSYITLVVLFIFVAAAIGIIYLKNRKDIKAYYENKFPSDYLPN